MKKLFLLSFIAFLAISMSGQQHQRVGSREPVEFAKEKIANIAKYIQVTKEDSTKLQKVFMDYQKEATAAMADREKRAQIVKGLQGKIKAVIGEEKYKIYREKLEADPANQRQRSR